MDESQIEKKQIDSINNIADDLFTFLRPIDLRSDKRKKSLSSKSFDFQNIVVDQTDIVSISTYDVLGRKLSKQFQTEKGLVGLSDADYPKLIKFSLQRLEIRYFSTVIFIRFRKN